MPLKHVNSARGLKLMRQLLRVITNWASDSFTYNKVLWKMLETTLLSFDNVVFSHYAFYTTAVLLEMFFLGLLTIRQRHRKQAFATPEDMKTIDDKVKGIGEDPDVERVRRVHMNDLENVPAFALLGLLYVATQPAAGVALWHFRIFAISRILYSIAYLRAIHQPVRALCYLVGLGVNISMAVRILCLAAY